jgi:hypothetical protein
MASPVFEVAQWNYENPDATAPLHMPVVLLCNTPDEVLNGNIATNTRKPLKWLAAQPERSENLILVGGGPSVAEHLAEIMRLKAEGGKIIAINAASKYLTNVGIDVDWQITCDAKDETATLIDPKANAHLFASQVSPLTMDRVTQTPLSITSTRRVVKINFRLRNASVAAMRCSMGPLQAV